MFSAGTDMRWVDGDSREDAYVPAVPTSIVGVTQAATLSVQRISGGTQQSLGAFVSDIYTPMSKLVLTLSARADHWKNYDGHNLETTVATGLPTANNRDTIPERNDTVFSPRVAALYHLTDRVTGWAAVNSGFRAPTLTELYRQFSVGAVTTRPNDQLGPERLVGGEAGVNVAPVRNLTARVTWYDNRVKNPVSNVTLNATTAQKQNLGKTRIWGVQSDVEYRLGPSLRLSGAYLYNQAKVTDGGVENAALVGKYLPQVPKHRGSLQIAYTNPKYASVALSVQVMGAQFNDDQNVQLHPGPDAHRRRVCGRHAGRPAGLLVSGPDRRARHQAEFSGVFRRPEPDGHRLFRSDQPLDHRHATPRQRRHPHPFLGPLEARLDGSLREPSSIALPVDLQRGDAGCVPYFVDPCLGRLPESTVRPVREMALNESTSPPISTAMND